MSASGVSLHSLAYTIPNPSFIWKLYGNLYSPLTVRVCKKKNSTIPMLRLGVYGYGYAIKKVLTWNGEPR